MGPRNTKYPCCGACSDQRWNQTHHTQHTHQAQSNKRQPGQLVTPRLLLGASPNAVLPSPRHVVSHHHPAGAPMLNAAFWPPPCQATQGAAAATAASAANNIIQHVTQHPTSPPTSTTPLHSSAAPHAHIPHPLPCTLLRAAPAPPAPRLPHSARSAPMRTNTPVPCTSSRSPVGVFS